MKTNKVLVKVFFPKIDKQYDVYIPLNKKVYAVINLLLKGLNDLNNDIYQTSNLPVLYNRYSGKHYDLNLLIQDTDIKNGTELIIM